ncbi:hypothetical protein JL720_14916 [Aureococcus anophagefferens]|nr:hypothetical protein JL720_14916 [Aureococcus anophagefferens]
MDMVKVALKHNEPSDPLDVLEETEKLFVKQKIETMEAVANAVAGAVGLGEFAALGEAANKCGSVYAGHVRVQEVLLLDRPFKCAGCCCTCHECCQQTLDVVFRVERRAPESVRLAGLRATPEQKAALDPALKIATVRQPLLGGGLAPSSTSWTARAAASISGRPAASAAPDTTFTVWSPEGLPIGKVTKEGARDFGELVQQSLTDADNFVLNFPKDTDKKTAAMLVAAAAEPFEDEARSRATINCACKFKCCDLYCCGCLTPRSCSCGEPAPPPPARDCKADSAVSRRRTSST